MPHSDSDSPPPASHLVRQPLPSQAAPAPPADRSYLFTRRALSSLSQVELDDRLILATRVTTPHFDHAACVRAALARGARPNACSPDGNSALHWACWSDLPHVVRLLLRAGADSGRRNHTGETPAMWASISGSVPCLVLLAEADASRARAGVVASCDEASAERERTRVQKRQARAAASVGPALPPPVTSVHAPVPMSSSSGEVSEEEDDESDYWEETSTISTLLSSSAASSRDSFVLDRCSNGFTCLHLASRYVKRPAADYLLSLGADIDSRDSDGRTPLHHACAFNHVPMAELLCTRGASPLARDAGGNTPLHVLAATGDFRELATAVMRFYNFAPAAAAKNDEGRTPAEVARLAGFGRLAAVIAKHDPTLKGRLDRWAHRVCSDPETGKDASMLWLGRWLLGCICLWLLLHMLVFTPAFHAQRAADAGKRAALSAATAAVAAAEKAATAGSMDHLTLAALAAAAADAASAAAAASVGGLTFWTVLFWLGGLGTVAAWLQCHYADPGVILPAPMMVRAVHTTGSGGEDSVGSLDGGEDDGGGDEEMRVGNRPSHVSPAPSLVADPVYLSLLAPPTPFPAHASGSGTDSISVPLWPLSVSAMARALVRLPHLPPAALGRLMQLYKTGWVRRSSFIPPSSAPVAAVGIPLLPLQAVPAASLYSLSTAPVVLPAAVTGLPRSPAGRARGGVSLSTPGVVSTQAPGRPSPQSVPPALHVMLTAHSCAFPRVKSPATPARKEPLPLVSGEPQELLPGALPRAAALAVALMSSPTRARAALLSAQGPDVAAALVAVAAAVAGQDSLSSDSRPSDAGMHSAAVTLTAALSEGGGDCGQLIVPSLATALLRPTVAETALAPPSFAPAAVVRGLAWVRARAPWLRPLLPEPAPAQASVASSVWSSFAGTKGSAEGNAWGVETSTTVWTPSGVANPSLPLRVTPPHLPFPSQLPRAWVSPILSEHPPSFLIVLGQLLFPSAWAHPSAAAPAPLSLPHTRSAHGPAHGPAHKVGDGLDRAMRSAAASAAAATASAVGAVGAGWSKLSGGAAGRGKVEPPVGVSLGARRGVENEDEDDDIEAQRGAADVNDTDVEDGPRDGGKRPLLAVSSATATATARSEPVGSISSPLPVSATPEDALASLFSTGDPVTDAAIGALLASLLSPAPRSHSTDDDDLDAEDQGHSTEAGGSWLSQPTPTRGRSEGFLPPLPPYGAEVEDTGPAGQRARMGPSVSSSRRMSDDSSDDDDSTQSSVRAPARSLCPAAATADKLLSLAAAPDTVAVAVLAAELERSLSRLLLPPSTHRAYSSPSATSSSSTGYGITAAAAVRALASPGLARLSPWLPSHPYAAPAPALHPAPGSARDGQGGARIVLGPGMSQGGPLLLPAERRPRVATVVCEANTGTDAPLPAPVAGTGGGGALLSVPPVRLAPHSTPGPTAWSVTVAAIAEAVYKAVVRTRRALRPRLPLTPPPTATTGPVCSGAALLWAGSESRPRQVASAAAAKALATAIAAAVCTRVAAGAGKALAVPLPEGLGLLTPSPAATTNNSSVNTHHYVSRTASLTPAAAASVAFSASSTVAVTAAQGGDIAGRGTVSMSNLLPPATAAAAAAAAVHVQGRSASPQDGCALGWGDRLALATELRGAILSVLASLTTVRIGAAAAAGAQWRLRDAVAPPSGAPSRTNEAKPRAVGGAQWLEPVPAPGQRRTRIGAASFIGTAAAHSRRSSDDADAAGEWASAGGLTLIDADRDADADAAVTSGGATSGSSSVMRGLPVGNTAAAEARWLRVVNDAIVEMSHGMAPAARAEEAAKELGVSFSQVNPRVVASTLSSAATLSVAASKEGYSRVGSSAPASASDDAPGETVALEDDTASSSIHDYLAASSSFRMPPPPAVVPTPAATTASADACCAPALTSASSPWESAARYLVLQPLGVHHTSSVCVTCRVAKPLRARHCRRCNRCVYRQDHHCPWVDTCVGGHNYRSFVLFCTLGSILSWSFVGCALSYIMSPDLLFPSLSLDSGISSASTALADAAARGSAPTPPPRSSIPGYIDAAASAAGLSSVGRLALAAAVAVASGSEPVYGGWATLWGMGGMVTAACTVHAAFMALFVSILWISHLYMVSVNCTTQEQFSTPPYLIHFDKGFLRNWINFLRGPMHEPLLFAQPTVAPHVKALSQPDSSAALLSPLDKARHHPRGDSDSDSDSDSHRRRSRSGRGPAPPPLALALAAAAADSGEFGYSDDDAYDALGAETAVASPSALSSTTVGRADDAPVPYDTERAPRSIVSSSGVMGDRDRYYAMGGVAGAWQPPQSSQQPAPAAVPAPAPAAAAPAPAAARSAFPPMPSFAPLGQIPVAGTALRAPSANAAAPSAAAKTL